MIRLLPVLLLVACATSTDEGTDDVAFADDDTATDTDTTGTTSSPSGPVAHLKEGGCVQGAVIEIDLETESPLTYQVEVKYSSGVWEPMQSSIHMRPSTAMIDGNLTDYESPIYRVGSTLTFTCGYQWEMASGPTIEGESAGLAVAWRVSWLTL